MDTLSQLSMGGILALLLIKEFAAFAKSKRSNPTPPTIMKILDKQTTILEQLTFLTKEIKSDVENIRNKI